MSAGWHCWSHDWGHCAEDDNISAPIRATSESSSGRSIASWSEMMQYPAVMKQEYDKCLDSALADAHFKESSLDVDERNNAQTPLTHELASNPF